MRLPPRSSSGWLRRVVKAMGEPIDAIGWDAPAKFLVGYGMDDAGRYRGLPYIAALD